MKKHMNNLTDFITKLPKAELHIHIEGSYSPELMFKIAERNKIALPYSSPEELAQAYKFSDLIPKPTLTEAYPWMW